MPSSNTDTKRGGRGLSILLGAVLLAVVAAAIALGRGVIPGIGGAGGSGGIGGVGSSADGASQVAQKPGLTQLRGVIGSEKRGYFEDPDVVARLEELGYQVSFSTAGSREIATGIDIEAQDFVFPSSAPAAQKVREQGSGYSVDFPFFSPMAVASWQPIAEILEGEGVVTKDGDNYVLDMAKFVDLANSGARWRDFGDTFASPRTVQIRSTDIRTSNSAAMYLAILNYEFQQRDPARGDDVNYLVESISPFFTGQGYSESSSSGPFAEYLAQGIGAAPMVMVYEAQYLGEQMSPNSRIRDDMVLLQLHPTVLANHGIVGVSAGGKELGKLLTNDPQLQQLAARHGFRPATSGSLAQELESQGFEPPRDYVNSIDPPNYDRLEQLIDGVGTRYGKIAPPPKSGEEE